MNFFIFKGYKSFLKGVTEIGIWNKLNAEMSFGYLFKAANDNMNFHRFFLFQKMIIKKMREVIQF